MHRAIFGFVALVVLMGLAAGNTTVTETQPSLYWAAVGDHLFINESKYAEAIEAYDKAIELDPKNATIWYMKGYALSYMDEKEKAIDAYDKAIEINPRYTSAWSNKAYVLSTLGKYDEAVEAYDEAIEIDPTNWARWDDKRITQEFAGINPSYHIKDFFLITDGNGITMFLSFSDENGKFILPTGKMLLYMRESGTSTSFNRVYNITKNNYTSCVGGIAIKKWLSADELLRYGKFRQNSHGEFSSTIQGQIFFQDEKNIIFTAKSKLS
ncbi:MAG: tetratricopeptide repeat protein [Methanothrix soehngenii]|mgnify:CR=1 FL=1|jgi:tetratricopeptide (TPR) repeat protein